MIHTKTFLRVVLVIVFIVVMSTTIGLSQTPRKGVKATGSVIHQLRIYEIFDGNKTAFHERFHDHAIGCDPYALPLNPALSSILTTQPTVIRNEVARCLLSLH
jgi:hypothetical protein